MRGIRKGGWFFASILLGMAINLLAIPLVIGVIGAEGWASLALGQTIGTFAAVVVGYGWPLVGPAEVARNPAGAGRYFARSLLPRGILFAFIAPVAVIVSALLTPSAAYELGAAVSCLSQVCLGLTGSWFLIGEGRARDIFIGDSIPRVAGVIFGALLLMTFEQPVFFPAAQLLGSVLAIILVASMIARRYGKLAVQVGSFRTAWRDLRHESPTVGASIAAALYVNAPTVVVSIVAPGALPTFALADRIVKFAQRALQPVSQIAQGYIPSSPNQSDLPGRASRAIKIALLVAVGAGVATVVLLPLAGEILSAGAIGIPLALSIPLGVTITCVVLTSVMGLAVIVGAGRRHVFIRSTVAGAALGLPLIVALSVTGGAIGSAWGVAATEAAVLAYQSWNVRQLLRPRKLRDTVTEKTRPIRVTIATPTIAPGGGPAGYVYNLRTALGRLKEPSLLVRYVGSESSLRSRYTGMDAPSVAKRIRRAIIRRLSTYGMSVVLAGVRSDVVVLHGYHSLAVLRMLQALKTMRLDQLQLWYMPHSPSPKYREERMVDDLRGSRPRDRAYAKMRRAEIALFHHAHRIIFPSRHASEEYVREFDEIDEARVRYILSGVSSPTTSDRHPVRDSSDAPRVLFAGRYVDHKGFDLFCEAARTLSGEFIDFMSIGAGLIRPGRGVTDIGWTEEPHSYAACADLIVVPNRIAYFDLWPLEVASLGKPMVMTEVGGNIDQIQALPDVIGCGVGSVAPAVQQALARIAAEPGWGAANASAYYELFTLEAMGRRWARALRDIHAS